MQKSQLLIVLEKIWREYPDLRFGQLIENIIVTYHNNHTSKMGVENDLWNWTNEQWVKAIHIFKEKHK